MATIRPDEIPDSGKAGPDNQLTMNASIGGGGDNVLVNSGNEYLLIKAPTQDGGATLTGPYVFTVNNSQTAMENGVTESETVTLLPGVAADEHGEVTVLGPFKVRNWGTQITLTNDALSATDGVEFAWFRTLLG